MRNRQILLILISIFPQRKKYNWSTNAPALTSLPEVLVITHQLETLMSKRPICEVTTSTVIIYVMKVSVHISTTILLTNEILL